METTERLVVELPSDLVAMLRQAVERGDFSSERDALSSILRAWHDDDEIDREIEAIRANVAEGLAEAASGEFIEADDLHAELRAHIKAIADRRG
jgi:Arc/MetJ-type ribon-helix-helix transcriptional regulator